MINERLKKIFTSIILTPCVIGSGDGIAVYDTLKNCIHVIDAIDFLNGDFENCRTLKRLSELDWFGNIQLANLEDFIAAYPDSYIEKYINASHSPAVSANIDKYAVAFIHLYKLYKSLDILVGRKYVQFIDSFIDSCMFDGSDHQATITYSRNVFHKVLRLRKAVFDMYEKYLNDYEIYKSIEYLHNSRGLSDKEFRAIKKKIRERIKKRKAEAEDTADSSVIQPAA